MHYYQFNVADYRKDTGHLSLLEHAIYRSLIDSYYLEELPLCSDNAKLMRSHSVRTKDEREAFNAVLDDFFILRDDGYHHQRCDEELARIYAKSEKARASAQKRWDKKNAKAMRTHSEGNANGMLPITQYPIPNTQTKEKAKTKRFVQPTYTEVLEYCQSRNNFVEAQRFIDFYKSNGWKVGKNKMKCWKAAVRNWEKNSKADHTKQAQKKTPLQRSLSDAEQLQAYYANEQAGHGYVGQDESTIPAQVGSAGRGIDGGRQTQPQLLDLVPSDGEFK